MIIAKQSFLLPFPSLLKKLRQLHSPPPPLIFQNEVLYTSQNNAAEARTYSVCNNKNTSLSGFCQATWLWRQQLKGERASSCCQCWAGWWGHSVAGDGEGAGHAAQGCPVPSGVWCRGTGTWRDADWKHTRSKQPWAMMCPQWEPWECCWQPVWEDMEGSAVSADMTHKKIYEGGIGITQRPTEVLKSEKCC